MLMRETASRLNPGAYLIGVAPAAAQLPFDDLRAILFRALKDFEES
jgi:hypothetical protein